MRYRTPFIGFILSFSSAALAQDLPEPLSSFSDCDTCPEMVVVPAGSFVIGSPAGEAGRRAHEGPQMELQMKEFAIGKYEVTFAQYDIFAESTGRDKPNDYGNGRGEKPVVDVSAEDTFAYADWLSEQTGKNYRLPTTAEWEYAARAGSITRFPWGDELGSNRANCKECGSQWDNKEAAPVGSFPPNAWGLHDTVGNVWEWTCSEYHGQVTGDAQICTGIEEDALMIVTRGGGYAYPADRVRSAFYHRLPRYLRVKDLGFRVVRDK